MPLLKKEDLNDVLYKSLIERKTYKQIAIEMDTTPTNIYNYVLKFKKEKNINRPLWKLDWYTFNGLQNEILDKYLDGVSTCKLGDEYGVTDHTMANWLREQGVEIRSVGKISKIDQTIFNTIDNEIKAYTLGLITADGNICKAETKNTITISLTLSDKYLLDQINNELLNGLGNIVVCNKKAGKPTATLQFNGKQLKRDVAKHGIVPNKSHILTQLSSNIPTELYHHYIRGLFDGDGVCSYETDKRNKSIKRVRVGYCAFKKEMTESYRNFLCDTLGISQNKLFNTGNCWQCSWAKKDDVKKFYDYIYKDATIFLGRKYKKLSNYVNTEVN